MHHDDAVFVRSNSGRSPSTSFVFSFVEIVFVSFSFQLSNRSRLYCSNVWSILSFFECSEQTYVCVCVSVWVAAVMEQHEREYYTKTK